MDEDDPGGPDLEDGDVEDDGDARPAILDTDANPSSI